MSDEPKCVVCNVPYAAHPGLHLLCAKYAALTVRCEKYERALREIADFRPESLESAEGDIAREAMEGRQ